MDKKPTEPFPLPIWNFPKEEEDGEGQTVCRANPSTIQPRNLRLSKNKEPLLSLLLPEKEKQSK